MHNLLRNLVAAFLFSATFFFTASAATNKPDFFPLFTIRWIVDISNLNGVVPVPEGERFSGIPVLSGNITDTTGALIGHIVPGLGGEHGYVDKANVVNVDVRYTILFEDGKYGYATMVGYGGTIHWRQCFVKIETASTKYAWLTNRFIFANGTFLDSSATPLVQLDHFGLATPPYPPLS